MLGCWDVGMLGCWDVGMLGCWDVGMLGCWDVGMEDGGWRMEGRKWESEIGKLKPEPRRWGVQRVGGLSRNVRIEIRAIKQESQILPQ